MTAAVSIVKSDTYTIEVRITLGWNRPYRDEELEREEESISATNL